MVFSELLTLLPFIVLATGSVILLLLIAFYRDHRLAVGLTLATFALTLVSLPLVYPYLPQQVTALVIVDQYAAYYLGLLAAAACVVTLLAYGYLAKRPGEHEELYLLLLLATLGSAVLVVSSHFASFFLGLELLTVSLYTLIAYRRPAGHSIEAGLKYLILAAVSTAFLLFGMALLYADLGTMALNDLAALLLSAPAASTNLFLLAGLSLTVIGIGFKLAVAPFHMWTPDIYEGASAPVTAFVATVSKGGMFALLLRYFGQMNSQAYPSLFLIFASIAAASMLAGNLLALLQSNVKRILAYSSIAHLGYLLVALLAGGGLGVTAVTYYLTAYFVTILAAFGLVALLSTAEQEAETMAHYRGLFWRRPVLAALFALTLLSLAGIPLTAGFIGKFFILSAGVSAALWGLVIILVISSAIGLYYYLRIIVVMGLTAEAAESKRIAAAVPLTGSLTLAGLGLLLLWLGLYPAPLFDRIASLVAGMI